MKTLLEAGVHFGHQTRRWDPRMRPFIFTERNGIHIIDLQQTVRRLDEAMTFVRQQAADGKTMLFVGTKKQAQDTISEEAARAGMPYVNQRWMGGTLTNFSTILTRLRRMEELKGIPIIIITGGDPVKFKDRAIAAGASNFFHKPIESDELLTVIRQTLGENATTTPVGG